MPQADGKNKLQRIQLVIKNQDGELVSYNFKINPENYTETYPQRTNMFKTRSSVIIEDFGPDMPTIDFSGTTGFGNLGSTNNGTGYDRMMELKSFLQEYSMSGHLVNGVQRPNLELYLYNHTDGGYYAVHLKPEGFSIERSADKSLLYNYKISLIVLRDANAKNPNNENTAGVGVNIPKGSSLKGTDFKSTTNKNPLFNIGNMLGYRLED